MDNHGHEDDWMPTFYIGQHESKRSLPVTTHVLRQAHECNYDMLTSPITTPYFQQRVLELVARSLYKTYDDDTPILTPTIPPLSPLDTPLTPGDITSQLLAFVSPWIDLCSPDPLIANVSRQVLYLEVAYAAFCGIEYVFIPGPRLYHGDARTHGTPEYARAIQEALSIGSHLQIHIMLSIVDDPTENISEAASSLASHARTEYVDDGDEFRPKQTDCFGTWDSWNMIRTVCKYSNRLSVALSLPQKLPILAIQSRWYSEPIKLLSLTCGTFVTNPKGKPVLYEPLRSFISRLMRIKVPPWILLCDVGLIPGLNDPDKVDSLSDGFLSPGAIAEVSMSPTPAEAADFPQKGNKEDGDITPHLSYLRYLQRRQPPRTVVEKYGSGYQDYLQTPLQPLTDNLESMTYEVFEKDPVKYDLYEEAIRRALRDWADERKPTSSPDGRVVVAVAGAGRGPLVTRALRASEAEGVDIELWAVEKNPNAYVLLQQHNRADWGNHVTVVQSDMRTWKGPWRKDASLLHQQQTFANDPTPGHTPIDILISELLGSFADNELSPECLDGIIHLLAPTHGISIPRSYTAFLTPLAAPKLHADISARSSWDPTASETPSVVWLHAIDYLSLEPQPPKPLANDPPSQATDPSNNAPTTTKDKGKSRALPPSQPVIPPSPLSPTPASTPLILPTWSFTHSPQRPISQPNPNTHNTRHARLSFRTRNRGVCHGLGGYFEAVLYPGVELSTNPNTMEAKSAGMISWFPIFFPLKAPLYMPDHSLLTAHIWRQTDGRKVWYEWLVEAWGYNLMIGGETRMLRLGGGELCSSKAGGCLM